VAAARDTYAPCTRSAHAHAPMQPCIHLALRRARGCHHSCACSVWIGAGLARTSAIPLTSFVLILAALSTAVEYERMVSSQERSCLTTLGAPRVRNTPFAYSPVSECTAAFLQILLTAVSCTAAFLQILFTAVSCTAAFLQILLTAVSCTAAFLQILLTAVSCTASCSQQFPAPLLSCKSCSRALAQVTVACTPWRRC
jgi:hypothetical protein